MRKAFIYLLVLISVQTLSAQGTSFLQPLQERDSVLIADQVLYGFELKDVEEGTRLAFPVIGDTLMTGIEVVSPWQVDTVRFVKGKKGKPGKMDIKASLTITSFDEAIYLLPPLAVQRMQPGGALDTLFFDPQRLEVKTMPVDTATFKPHDIKGQIRYPVTFRELLPWIAGTLVLAGLVWLCVWLVLRWRRSLSGDAASKEPPHIVALRRLDRYRGNKFWAPEKQKEFYSGITDALREYIAARYEIGAMEMTTAEIFEGMKNVDVSEDLVNDVRELFERADFVKFAKFVASDEDNAGALPLAVRFVTSTYQTEVEEETQEKKEVNDVL